MPHPSEDISYAYGPNTGNGDGGFLSVGAENKQGNRSQNTYFNGTGTLPSNGTQLVVTPRLGCPGETRVITFSARPSTLVRQPGPWTKCTEMTSNLFQGMTETACVTGTVRK